MTIIDSNREKSKTTLHPVREPVIYTTVTLLIMCTILVGFSLYWNINNLNQDQFNNALAEAKANWNKDQAFRDWATRHGDIYVKPDKRTQPSPYLAHLPNRDVVTTDGMKLTLLNPAFIMRQMTEEYEESYGIKGKITGKTVLNPINEADEWEKNALDALEKGKEEIYSEELINDEPYLRYMKPMIMQKGCMKCHAGTKVGEIRGGVSVSIPMKPYLSLADSTTQSILITHLLVLFLGYLGIISYSWMAKKREAERLNYETELKQHHERLEERVLLRTQELKEKEQEAKENAKRLNQIMDTAAEGIITSNKNGTIESFNRAAEKIFGYTAKEIIGKSINMLIPGPHKQKHNDYINQYLETGHSIIIGRGREIEAQRKDGSFFPASVAISDMQFDHKRIFTAIIHDMTPIKENELALIDAKEVAEKANMVKSDFLSSMSHDLRTPLNAILGFGQLLECIPNEPLTTTQNQYVEQIMKGGEHLLQLINDILDLAKIEAEKVELITKNLEIHSVLDDCLFLIQPLAEAHNIKINDDYKNQDNRVIKADNKRIKQVLLNIISNAIKYNIDNGSITIDHHEIENNKLRITIKDTGMGISQDKQSEIFTPFFRVETQDASIEGTGIGLTVSRKLISLMNGSIDFVSETGKGSEFWIDIPLIENPENLKINRDINADKVSGKYSTIDKLKGSLLYIEDNPANLRLMEAITANIDGLTFMSAINARDGISLAKEKQPDIIILDINLPDMHGFDAFKELTNTPETAHIPVIALSASASQTNIEAGLAAGFKYYLTKPIDINKIVSVMKTLLKKNNI